MKRTIALVVLFAAAAFGQSPQLSPAVKAFVKYDQPTIALTHVRVIDGTGAPAREKPNGGDRERQDPIGR